MKSLFDTLNHFNEQQIKLLFLKRTFNIFLRNIFRETGVECKASRISAILYWHKYSEVHCIHLFIEWKISDIKDFVRKQFQVRKISAFVGLCVKCLFVKNVIEFYIDLIIDAVNICCHFLMKNINHSIWSCYVYRICLRSNLNPDHENFIQSLIITKLWLFTLFLVIVQHHRDL